MTTGSRWARRPVRPLVAVWLAAAGGLGLLLLLAGGAQGPLDDRDQAWQRPGFLDAGDLPAPAPDVAPGVPTRGRPAVVFFERPGRIAALCRALERAPMPGGAAAAVAVAGRPPARCGAATVVGDAGGALAAAYGLRRPRDGGSPAGYAVVDGHGAIRYRTLDPGVAGRLGEVATMVAALP